MIRHLFLISLLMQSTLARNSSNEFQQKWMTLNDKQPLVIANGGFSGFLPPFSRDAYEEAFNAMGPDVILFCRLQLTKDGMGICYANLTVEDPSFQDMHPNGQKTYNVFGENVFGWFVLDYTLNELQNITMIQTGKFRAIDAARDNLFSFDNIGKLATAKFWLHVENSNFYAQHKLSMVSYLRKVMRLYGINYISSPQIDFLKNMNEKVNKTETKLIFAFPEAHDQVEPSSKQAYKELLKNLSFIKSFASGILVPKGYIWPVDANRYLMGPTSLVLDAHKQGLEVYSSGFANDQPASYNYNYDPTAEYLQFIDNSKFSVDGFVTDYPPTAYEAISCLAHNKNSSKPVEAPLIISYHGSSGVYAGSSNLAYVQAIDDGADIIDCSVQMSKDKIFFCLGSPNLLHYTDAMGSSYMSRSATISGLQDARILFSFDLTWREIQTLKPTLSSPFEESYDLLRNPGNQNKGKFMSLQEFLEFAKVKNASGILINIEKAKLLSSRAGFNILNRVASILSTSTFGAKFPKGILIQSDDISVLSQFEDPIYRRVLSIKKMITEVPDSMLNLIKKHADAITIIKTSIIPGLLSGFSQRATSIVDQMHKANISVYVSIFMNEFPIIFRDMYGDPIVELMTYIKGIGVDGVTTEFPATANAYLRSPCFKNPTPEQSRLVPKLGQLKVDVDLPPLSLNASDISGSALPFPNYESSLHPAIDAVVAPSTQPPETPPQKNDKATSVANLGLGLTAIMLLCFLHL